MTFGRVPIALRTRDLARQAPRLCQVLARTGPGRQLETFGAVRSRGAHVSARECELAHAGEHPDRIPVAHPQARRGIEPVPEDAVVLILRTQQLAPGPEDLGEIELC